MPLRSVRPKLVCVLWMMGKDDRHFLRCTRNYDVHKQLPKVCVDVKVDQIVGMFIISLYRVRVRIGTVDAKGALRICIF